MAQEAIGALAGPVFGVLGAIATLELSHTFDSQLLRALAYTAFFINLFNLIPALPLDGGRVAGGAAVVRRRRSKTGTGGAR